MSIAFAAKYTDDKAQPRYSILKYVNQQLNLTAKLSFVIVTARWWLLRLSSQPCKGYP